MNTAWMWARGVVLVLVWAQTHWIISAAPESCDPLEPMHQKRAALQRYKQGLAPLLFMHIQKAGGKRHVMYKYI